MKRIYKNGDLKYHIDADKRIGEKFKIKFFTTNKNFYVLKTSDDVINELKYTDEAVINNRYLKLNWSELKTLGSGVLNYICNVYSNDSDFDDDKFNDTFTRTTSYYINNGIRIEDVNDESFNQIVNSIKTKVDEIQIVVEDQHQMYNNLTDEIEKLKDTSSNQPTIDLSNYYTKEETDSKLTAEIGKLPKTDLSNYYTKEESDSKLTAEIGKLPKPDLSNYFTKEELLEKLTDNEKVNAEALTELRKMINENEKAIAGILASINERIKTLEQKHNG